MWASRDFPAPEAPRMRMPRPPNETQLACTVLISRPHAGVLGDPEPVRVCAVVGTRYGTYDVDDDAIVLISWSNGTNSLVESGWWQGSQACTGGQPTAATLDQLMTQVQGKPPARCDEVAWSLFGISLAGYNFLISLALAAIAAVRAAIPERER